jgi:hypothetical protein
MIIITFLIILMIKLGINPIEDYNGNTDGGLAICLATFAILEFALYLIVVILIIG